MRIRQLEYFVRICELGSITKAAAQLNVAQPAVGMQIKALEQELGVQLLLRTRRGIAPTDAGAMALDEFKSILCRVNRLKDRIKDARANSPNIVNIGLTPSLSTYISGGLIEACRSEIRCIQPRIFEDFSYILLDKIDIEEIDLALAYSVPVDRYPNSRPILRETLYFTASPSSQFGDSGPISLKDLSRAPLVTSSDRDLVLRIVNEMMSVKNLELNVEYRVKSMTAMRDLIGRGMAYGILPSATLARDISDGTLIARPIVDPPVSRTLFLVQSVEPNQPGCVEVIRIIERLLRELCMNNPSFECL